MSYIKTVWENSPSTQTPINADNLNHMEDGIYNAQAAADQAQAGVDNLNDRNFAPVPVELASEMTEEGVNYLYLGEEEGYDFGYLYYINAGGTLTKGSQYQTAQVVTDTTLEVEGAAADAKAAGDAITSLRSALTKNTDTLDESVYSVQSVRSVYATYAGKKADPTNGLYSSDANYTVDRYTVTAEKQYKVVAQNMTIVFQSGASMPETGTNTQMVGTPATGINGVITIPTGATNMLVSRLTADTSCYVALMTDNVSVIKGKADAIADGGIVWEKGYINTSGAEVASENVYKRTNYIPIGAIIQPLRCDIRCLDNISMVAYFDEGKNWIKSDIAPDSTLQERIFVVSESVHNAKYVRVSSNVQNGFVPQVYFVVDGGSAKLSERSVDQKHLGNDILSLADGANMIDYNALHDDKYIDASGKEQTSANVYATDYIPVIAGKTYYQENIHNTYYAFYNEHKEFVSGYSTLGDLSDSITIPNGCYFARFTLAESAHYYENAWLNTKNEMPSEYQLALNKNIKVYAGSGTDVSNPCDYQGEEITTFVKGICIGDSLTAGAFNISPSGNIVLDKYSFPRSLERLTGIEITNMGHSGYSSAEWYEAYSSADVSGHDFAIIQLGVNDQIRYGEFGDTSKTAFENIFTMLKTQNPKIKIFVANIIPALSYQTEGYIDFSDDLLAWVEAKHALDVDIIPIDIQQYGHTADSTAFNCGHLSAFGYNQLARDYKAYLSYYMATNKTEFRKVQFIGTNYDYDN